MGVPTPETSRIETEMSLGWAQANPALFVASVKAFQTNHPITDWRHHVDLSREHMMTLIAVRRDKPFASVTDYVMHPSAYLNETGYN